MEYRINEIFYSLQGEGLYTGMPALFIRFAGCNFQCAFCDTEHENYSVMTADEIEDLVYQYRGYTHLVVFTGGEPTLQLDEELVLRIKELGFTTAMETNGSLPPPQMLDHVTFSPKIPRFNLSVGSSFQKELKLVFKSTEETDAFLSQLEANYGTELEKFYLETIDRCFLQPCDTGDPVRNRKITVECIDYIMNNDRWRLSLQTHKLLGIQ